MPRYNSYSKPRVREQKESFYEVEERRTLTILSLIKANGSISDFEIQRILKFGPGVQERMMRMIKNNYKDCVSWDKETRLFKHIPVPQEENPNIMVKNSN